MALHVVTIVGVSIIFLIFVILYITFRVMGYVFEVSRRRIKKKEEIVIKKTDEEIVAAISAVLSQIFREKHRIISLKPIKRKNYVTKRGYTIWRRVGWKGVRKWQESSRL